jgi:hypothetical protein
VSSLLILIVVLGVIIVPAVMVPIHRRPRDPITRTHRGLEMKAHGGRLVYVRETESEREI